MMHGEQRHPQKTESTSNFRDRSAVINGGQAPPRDYNVASHGILRIGRLRPNIEETDYH